ncbi:helix-turn-helix domain-containing protein [Segatella bryantii]|uniref:helix-turn-helix domain-containing protein n=1 Tax=Segatella bryantii TaxID=77095 RepID=UPI00242BCBC2|nr:helix-turn-helix domain-containing protein [Segatella bryantii]
MYNENYLEHYGTPRHSGRYPWGSGKDPYQHGAAFLGSVQRLKAKGLTEKQIATAMGYESTGVFRAHKEIALEEDRGNRISQAVKLREKGLSPTAIGKRMGLNESSVRSLLAANSKTTINKSAATANMLKEQFKTKKYIDIGDGSENVLNVSKEMMSAAIERLKVEGYDVMYVKVKQATTNHATSVKVLVPPGTKYKDLANNQSEIKPIQDVYTNDAGLTWRTIETPVQIKRSRVLIKHKEEGGTDKDGLIELRRGVPDLDLGKNNYAQVRIAVEGNKYMKGMAVYSDDIPKGYDVIYNTNKSIKKSDDDIYKDLYDKDPNEPFSSIVCQSHYKGPDGKEHLSALNIVGDDGSEHIAGAWRKWDKNLPTQFLAKQPRETAKKQLQLDLDQRKAALEEINAITNPVIRKKELEDFGDECDSAANEMKGAAFPRQQTHVLIPCNSLKENEIYAPNYRNGEEVILVRFPHEGIFEIPRLIVNNKNKEAKNMLGQAPDAVAINHKVAAILSGADFDGDTAMVIPTKNQNLINKSPLEGLKDFDTGMYELSKSDPKFNRTWKKGSETEHKQMGIISNLITDMTIQGASDDELARATRHAMVIIDTGKHHLDYWQSERDNNIPELIRKYQKKVDGGAGGAGTLLSRAKGEKRIPERAVYAPIDPKTGKRMYRPTGGTHWDATKKKMVPNEEKITNMAYYDDARSLISTNGSLIEEIYAAHANALKALGNEARKQSMAVEIPKINKAAKDYYANEYQSLKDKVRVAKTNSPLERQAQIIFNEYWKTKLIDNPSLISDKSKQKKERAKLIRVARSRVGAKSQTINITEKEWDAIQANAVGSTLLKDILRFADADELKKRAMPKDWDVKISSAQKSRLKAMYDRGYTQAEIADALNISVSTVNKYISGDKE